MAGDRVAAENFQQHAEHYVRLLSEALKEQNEKREQQESINAAKRAEKTHSSTEEEKANSDSDKKLDMIDDTDDIQKPKAAE